MIEIIGAYCVTRKDDDVKEWLVKVPGLKVMKDSSLVYFPGVYSHRDMRS